MLYSNLKPFLILALLVVNFGYIVFLRKYSEKIGGKPPSFLFHLFLRYIYNQSKKTDDKKLSLLIYTHYVLLGSTFVILVFVM